MKLKLRHFLFLFLPVLSFGQDCDTLYSHENYVERKVEIEYRNCHLIKVDSVYKIVQWLNADSNYLKPFFSENICQSLYHSVTGRLIQERWQVGDTVCAKIYYASGQLKSHSKNVFIKTPYYFHNQLITYYEDGSFRYKGEYKSSSFSTHISYYPNGGIETRAKRFSYNSSPFGEYLEYFPNGQISMIQKFSEPDTTTNQYQQSTSISTEFYNENGKETESNLNEYKKLYLSIYPPIIDETLMVGDFYTSQQFEDQEAYTNDMINLKNRIIENLDLSNMNCAKGIIWISLNITKKGNIEILEIDFENETVRKKVEQSIYKIKKWPAALKDGTKVDTHVYTYLIINK